MFRSVPDNRAGAKFSYKKYYPIRKLLFSPFGSFKRLGDKMRADMQIQNVAPWLLEGDSQPAVVVNADPFVIAAYSDEFDAVVMLEFPKELYGQYSLSVGSRLVTSCIYLEGDVLAGDIFPGPNGGNKYQEFVPIVQLFLCKNEDKAKENVSLFSEDHWRYVESLAKECVAAHPDVRRDDFFYFK